MSATTANIATNDATSNMTPNTLVYIGAASPLFQYAPTRNGPIGSSWLQDDATGRTICGGPSTFAVQLNHLYCECLIVVVWSDHLELYLVVRICVYGFCLSIGRKIWSMISPSNRVSRVDEGLSSGRKRLELIPVLGLTFIYSSKSNFQITQGLDGTLNQPTSSKSSNGEHTMRAMEMGNHAARLEVSCPSCGVEQVFTLTGAIVETYM